MSEELKQARELLAAEFTAGGLHQDAAAVRKPESTPLWMYAPLYAIQKALSPTPPADVELVARAMARVIAMRHNDGKEPSEGLISDWLNDCRREEARAAIAAIPQQGERERWLCAETAPENIGRCLAVEDDPVTCRWHFAHRVDGRWHDLCSGDEITPSHYQILPPPPSGWSEERSEHQEQVG